MLGVIDAGAAPGGAHRRKELPAMIYLIMKLIRKLKRHVPS